jgi:hypothetical protein
VWIAPVVAVTLSFVSVPRDSGVPQRLTGLFGPHRAQASPLPGQITVDATNPQWLVRPDGSPVFICGPGDPEGFLYRGTENADGTRNGDQLSLINRMMGTGANSIYLMAVRSHGGDGDADENPFVDRDHTKPLNRAVLDQWDTWFSTMDAAGIVIYFIFYDDGTIVWNTGDQVLAPEKAFFRELVNRFESHANLIWVIAEEYQEGLSRNRASALAAEIRDADDHDHVIAIHQLNGINFDFADDPNIDQFAIQYNVASRNALHAGMLDAWTNAAGRYQLMMAECAAYGGGAVARQKSWACAMGGAYVMIYEMDIASTAVGDLVDCGNLVSFMESTPFHRMAPHDELKLGQTEYVLAEPGQGYIAYGAGATSSLGIRSLPAGTYTLHWFDCMKGTRETTGDVVVSGGDTTWPKPTGFTSEVAVYAERSSAVSVSRESWADIKAKFR